VIKYKNIQMIVKKTLIGFCRIKLPLKAIKYILPNSKTEIAQQAKALIFRFLFGSK
jgi:hypothetical protein